MSHWAPWPLLSQAVFSLSLYEKFPSITFLQALLTNLPVMTRPYCLIVLSETFAGHALACDSNDTGRQMEDTMVRS